MIAAFAAGFGLAAVILWSFGPSPIGSVAVSEHASTGRPEPAGEARSAGVDRSRVEQLEAELALERAMRERLTDQVVSLTREIDDFASAVALGDEPGAPAADRAAPGSDEEGWFDGSSLEAFGFAQSEIERIEAVWERVVLARLENENKRVRAGRRAGRGHGALAIELQARAELGDEGYDAMLFAAGESNRVVMSDLLDQAPVALAGAEPGDEIISYAGQRIFSAGTLKRLTATGMPGEQTELQVMREGEIIRLFLDRGPLGARLSRERLPPLR